MTTRFKTVTGLKDLGQFGINALTSEACSFGLRILCDVNEAGKQLLEEFFSFANLELSANWNSTVDGVPAVGSIMLSRSITFDLAQFALFRAGALSIVSYPDSVTGVFEEALDQRYEAMLASESAPKEARLIRNPRRFSSAPAVGSRNVHAASGRAM